MGRVVKDGKYAGVNRGAIQIRNLDPELRQWYAILAIRQDRPAQEVYREALREYMERNTEPDPETKT